MTAIETIDAATILPIVAWSVAKGNMKAETLNAAKVTHWLEKTGRTISNTISRGGTTDMETNSHLSALVARYDELMDRAKELGVWNAYCDKHGWSRDHTGFDCAG